MYLFYDLYQRFCYTRGSIVKTLFAGIEVKEISIFLGVDIIVSTNL